LFFSATYNVLLDGSPFTWRKLDANEGDRMPYLLKCI